MKHINVSNEVLAFECRLFQPIGMLQTGDNIDNLTNFPILMCHTLIRQRPTSQYSSATLSLDYQRLDTQVPHTH